MSDRIVVVGASGYIGLHIVKLLLARGKLVTAVVRSGRKLGELLSDDKLRFTQIDLRDSQDMRAVLQGQRVCIHAGLIWDEPETEFDAPDVAASARLFEEARRAGVRRSIYISSAAVHMPLEGIMSEEDCLAPNNIYGATKAAGEMFLRAACSPEGMSGVVIRPGPVVGTPAIPKGAFRTPHKIQEMVQAAQQGAPIKVKAHSGRQLSAVRLVAEAIAKVCELDEPHPTYCCMDSSLITWESVAKMVIQRVGGPSKVCVHHDAIDTAPPRFRTDRIQALISSSLDARAALEGHLDLLLGPKLDEISQDSPYAVSS